MEGFNIKPIHIVNNDPKELVDLFVSNLLEISKKPYELNIQIYKNIYKQMGNLNNNKKKCFVMFEKWIK